MNFKSKLFVGAVALTMVLGVAIPASAATTAELTAQINALLAQIAQLQAQISGGSAQGSAIQFNSDLTVGSTGADVTSLQQFLVGKGYLQMPANVAYGYFGPITKAALAAYQASVGITPAVGYFGPITRANVNSVAGAGTTGGSTYVPAGSITTPGVEGTLTVTNSTAGLVSTAYEGDSKVAVLGFKVQAKTSDIAVQRVKVNLNDSTKVYNAVYSKMYVTDAEGNVLTSSDLNSSTVTKEGSTYYITFSGFNYIVPKDTTKQMYIKADLYSSIDSTDVTNFNASYNTLTLANSGVRGVDGAGIDQYSPSTGSTVTKAVTIAATLADSASLSVSLNNSSPKKQDVVAAGGTSNNELDKLTVLVFDLKAEKDNVLVTDLRIGVVDGGLSAANVTTAYIYDGSTELDNASITSNMATFSDIDITVPKDSTKTLTVKVDVRGAVATRESFIAYASTTAAADLVSENSMGDSITETGTATGYEIGVRSVGPEITLVSKSVTTDGVPQGAGSNTNSTSTLSATFNVKIKAVGGDLIFGDIASTTSGRPLFGKTGATNSFKAYLNGVAAAANVATSTSYTIPSNCTPISGLNSCTLSEGSEVTIPVTYSIVGRSITTGAISAGLYAIGLEQVNWNNGQTTTFMAGETDWRTSDVSFP